MLCYKPWIAISSKDQNWKVNINDHFKVENKFECFCLICFKFRFWSIRSTFFINTRKQVSEYSCRFFLHMVDIFTCCSFGESVCIFKDIYNYDTPLRILTHTVTHCVNDVKNILGAWYKIFIRVWCYRIQRMKYMYLSYIYCFGVCYINIKYILYKQWDDSALHTDMVPYVRDLSENNNR